MTCDLCHRDLEHLTEHHLTPRSKLKAGETTPTIGICSACHRQIHALFSNQELHDELNTLERLRDEPRVQRFLRWVRKQDPNKRVRVRK